MPFPLNEDGNYIVRYRTGTTRLYAGEIMMEGRCACGAKCTRTGAYKAMYPPIYHYRCPNGHDMWFRNGGEALHLRGIPPSLSE